MNGAAYPNIATEVVREGDLVRFTIVNRSQDIPPWHLHGHRVGDRLRHVHRHGDRICIGLRYRDRHGSGERLRHGHRHRHQLRRALFHFADHRIELGFGDAGLG